VGDGEVGSHGVVDLAVGAGGSALTLAEEDLERVVSGNEVWCVVVAGLLAGGVDGDGQLVVSWGVSDVDVTVLDLVASGVGQEVDGLAGSSGVGDGEEGGGVEGRSQDGLLGGDGVRGDSQAVAWAVDDWAELDKLAPVDDVELGVVQDLDELVDSNNVASEIAEVLGVWGDLGADVGAGSWDILEDQVQQVTDELVGVREAELADLESTNVVQMLTIHQTLYPFLVES